MSQAIEQNDLARLESLQILQPGSFGSWQRKDTSSVDSASVPRSLSHELEATFSTEGDVEANALYAFTALRQKLWLDP